eukprot:TRINITY_DN20611_c0_g1_i1.p2 TRINITY_DN20611_c0_g1~~TRINITY_DN20611_c0_g1_i1.p2  ORF type:complete len:143 (-),score=4.84 TRINITY_DN20611_c0_g1_i1:289-717(-)
MEAVGAVLLLVESSTTEDGSPLASNIIATEDDDGRTSSPLPLTLTPPLPPSVTCPDSMVSKCASAEEGDIRGCPDAVVVEDKGKISTARLSPSKKLPLNTSEPFVEAVVVVCCFVCEMGRTEIVGGQPLDPPPPPCRIRCAI